VHIGAGAGRVLLVAQGRTGRTVIDGNMITTKKVRFLSETIPEWRSS